MVSKSFIIISFFTLISCNKDMGVFTSWENKISHKKIDFSDAEVSKAGRIVLSDDCHADLKIDGKKHIGDIHVGHSHGNCKDGDVPVKMNYKVMQKGLKVCSDFKSGKHHCEMLKKK